jgi:2-oxoglutarate dehydrogenase E1 component
MHNSIMELMWSSGHLSGGNAEYVEQLYDQYLKDASQVTEEWRQYFDSLPKLVEQKYADVSHREIQDHFRKLGKTSRFMPVLSNDVVVNSEHENKQVQVLHLISSYRVRGHQKASLDPLSLMHREQVPDLQLDFHNLSAADNSTVFQTGSLQINRDTATLREIVESLESIYCGSTGYEFMHIVDLAQKQWLQKRIEPKLGNPGFSQEVKRHLLDRLSAAEGLEKHLDSKYPGTKRFGLEGGESLIPLCDELIQRAGSYGVKEVVIGMAHRGRLNMLVNILGKNPADLFNEFEGRAKYKSSGDVKYHQGFSSNIMTPGGEVHLAMAFNPSHLEIVSPVVEGSVRARQDRRKDNLGHSVIPISIHGDAAFAGQGVVMETFQMSKTRAYGTGGTVHIVINNQVGFTTSRQDDARSTEYCTDVAKMVQAPIFHVNADDPEAVLFVTQLALDFRYEFKKDVVIDLFCYRRRGHNETDEPASTQPIMYAKVRQMPTTRALYADKMIAQGIVTEAEVDELNSSYRSALDTGSHVVKSLIKEPNVEMFVDWNPYLGHTWSSNFNTSIKLESLQALAKKITTLPTNLTLHRQVQKISDDRSKMATGELAIDWGFAETLAYASILTTGNRIRLTGQDVGRGTFSHRHAVLRDQNTEEEYVPLRTLVADPKMFSIYDSLLSEAAVLAFEYGYSTTSPNALVIWEAQFGDFANCAQVVIDQFITSGEQKWQRLCGLTMLLPHGYEGQGPEHSSARLERFLQMCAEQNIQVCLPTTSAQVFHMLRRQVLSPLRKPLVVMSPKSLLRHKETSATLEELANGTFQVVIGETDSDIVANTVDRVILCSGKVYYDLRAERRARGSTNIAIVRLEQLYPFPDENLKAEMKKYAQVSDVVWCQEEPMNQGAWYSSQHNMRNVIQSLDLAINLRYAGREASASPAAGYPELHNQQLKAFLEQALGQGK